MKFYELKLRQMRVISYKIVKLKSTLVVVAKYFLVFIFLLSLPFITVTLIEKIRFIDIPKIYDRNAVVLNNTIDLLYREYVPYDL